MDREGAPAAEQRADTLADASSTAAEHAPRTAPAAEQRDTHPQEGAPAAEQRADTLAELRRAQANASSTAVEHAKAECACRRMLM